MLDNPEYESKHGKHKDLHCQGIIEERVPSFPFWASHCVTPKDSFVTATFLSFPN